MDKIFTFKEAIHNNVKVFKSVDWPEGHHVKMSYIGDLPYPRCEYHVPEYGVHYMIPTTAFPEDDKIFTFEDGISSYDEYFDKYAYGELSKRIKNIKKRIK